MDPALVKAVCAAVGVPVMAAVRVGHFVEAQILQAAGADFADESEVLTPVDSALFVVCCCCCCCVEGRMKTGLGWLADLAGGRPAPH